MSLPFERQSRNMKKPAKTEIAIQRHNAPRPFKLIGNLLAIDGDPQLKGECGNSLRCAFYPGPHLS
jgi:hypothetical protein